MNKLPIFEICLTDNVDVLGLALVEDPAIKVDFLCFSEDKIEQKMFFNEDKMIVKGPALIPNKLIYRNDIPGGRYIYFSEETVIAFAEKLMSKKENPFNFGHTDEKVNANIIESYFSSVPNEFDVPKNSWIVSLKIEDAQAWADIKSNKYNGFSVQDKFSSELISLSKQDSEKNMIDETKKNKIFDYINSILFGEQVDLAADVTPSGDTVDIQAVSGDTVDLVPSGDTVDVQPVSGDTVNVKPVSGDTTDPVVDPALDQELKPLDEIKIKEMISESQSETVNQLKVLIDELSAKIEAYGNTPEVAPAPVTGTVENKAALVSTDNPYAKFFPQK